MKYLYIFLLVMKVIFTIFIFLIVLFIYLHIYFHLKTSDELEVYEIDNASKDKLEEICDLRQPVLFDMNNESFDKLMRYTTMSSLLESYPAFEMKLRNAKDTNYDTEIHIPLHTPSLLKLFDEDKDSQYFTENNGDFLKETGVLKHFQHNDSFFRPYMVSNCLYDIISGSTNTTTPFRYELNYRNYFMVTQGSVSVKLTPPIYSKYLQPIYDYENFEFRSPINPWNIQSQYKPDFDKVKCLDVVVNQEQILQIPAYWWYSIKFGKNTSISTFRYRTYMNNLAILPHTCMYALQLQNVKRDVVKKVNISEINYINKNDNET